MSRGEGPDRDVAAKLDVSQQGQPRQSLRNTCLVLDEDERWRVRLSFNAFEKVELIDGRPITDVDVSHLMIGLDEIYGLRPSVNILERAVHWACVKREVHPVREWLASLRWDGQPRLVSFLHGCMGADDTPLNGELGLRWFIGAVARIFKPGCDMHTSLVFAGAQGIGKSRACRALVPDPSWFNDSALPLGSKDAYMQLQGVWIYEIAEMHALEAAGNASAKAFLTSPDDRFRPPYGRRVERHPRQVVFIGTTNKLEFLSDASGSRRYWPVRVREVDLRRIEGQRDQLWAEAVHHFKAGQEWWLSADWAQELAAWSATFNLTEVWEELVLPWAEEQTEPFTTWEVLEHALGFSKERGGQSAPTRVGLILRRAGYEKSRARQGTRRSWVWLPSCGDDLDGKA
ncbi:MAG: hypothetical protein H6741_27795 [Alphaproteobacteria bacterium]|nr:hypothetical protein [Alphaproteobacteria bacterium]